MKLIVILKRTLLVVSLLSAAQGFAKADPQVLVTVDGIPVTADELQSAMASAPFGTRFASMDRDAQAALRGDMLQRLVASRLLYQEALDLGLDRSPEFQRDVEQFKLGLLYRYFMHKLRAGINIPEDILESIKQQNPDDADGVAAAKAMYVSSRYKKMRFAALDNLRRRYHVKILEENVRPGQMTDDTLLLQGDGLKVTYGDVKGESDNREAILGRLYKAAELQVIAKATAEEGVDVSGRIDRYKHDRLPAMLMERKQKEWLADPSTLRDYYDQHPEIHRTLERWHIGQIVLGTRDQAEALHKRILGGESLFILASKYSIDPYGKAHNGDMGWVSEGTGNPAIEKALSGLKDNQISEIVETPMGFHILTILERSPSLKRSFASVRDKVAQMLVNQKTAEYMNELSGRHKVTWNLVDSKQKGK